MAEPLRVTETLKPVSVKKLRPGVYIFDMGQNMVGWCRLHGRGSAGARRSRCAMRRRWSRTARCTWRICARATRHGHLHAEGRRTGNLGAAFHVSRIPLCGGDGLSRASRRRRRSKAAWCTTIWSATGEFTSSNELLNKIHHNMFWGIRGNYRSIPTDCPQRDERQGWLGDRVAGEPQRELHVRRGGVLLQVDDRPGGFAAAQRQHSGCFAQLLAALQRRPHVAEHLPLRARHALRPVRRPARAGARLSLR